MEDVQDFARRLQAQETQQLKKTFVHFLIFQTVFALNHFFFPHQLSKILLASNSVVLSLAPGDPEMSDNKQY